MGSHSHWWQHEARSLDPAIIKAATEHQNQLTKPQGSLGRLEAIAIQLAGIQNQLHPHCDKVAITVFAGDHGVVEEGVSAFPQAVTGEMLKNFVSGGAAIAVLSRALNAQLQVVNVGSLADPEALPGVIHRVVAKGTASFSTAPAMTPEQLEQALQVGKDVIDGCATNKVNLWIGGEMGIGNTTAAAAIISELLHLDPAQVVGPGTGLTSEGMQHKARVIAGALSQHQGRMDSPLHVLQHVGGFEIAALAGAYIRAAQLNIACVVDGFICGAAALVATRMNPSIGSYLLFSHRSAEPGHQVLLNALGVEPIVDLTMRLGEGSGAAIVVPLIQSAVQLHNQMATFAAAGVSEKLDS